MTVNELKHELEQFNGDLEVVRADNSGGYEKIYSTYFSQVVDNFNNDKNKNVIVLD